MDNQNCCGSTKKADHCQKNIRCEVTNCTFHSKEGLCEAAQIEVGPCDAECCEDTVCKTFHEKQ